MIGTKLVVQKDLVDIIIIIIIIIIITPWLMKIGSSLPHSQGLSNNPYPELNQPNSSYRLLFFQDAF